MHADVVVIGAGVAGLSAAARLAEAGARVVVVDEAPRLGGRASAFTDKESGERVDNGQHVLFGCYHATYEFLRRVGADNLAPLDRTLELAMAGSDGRAHVLRCPRVSPPWHLVLGILQWRALPLADRLSALHLRTLIARARRDGGEAVASDVPDGLTVADWLASMRQSPAISRWLWHPLAFAALNQSPDVAAARPFVRVIAELFGPAPADSSIGLPVVPLDELYAEPARRFIEARGGTVLLKSSAQVLLDASGNIAAVRAGGVEIQARAVISAVPWHALVRIWGHNPPPSLAETCQRAAAMEGSPIVTVNLWMDGPVMQTRLVGLVEGPMHWVFDKSAFFAKPAGHLSVVSSGAVGLAGLSKAEITAACVAQLRGALPEFGRRNMLRSVVVREHRASFSLAPGGPSRPSSATGLPGFYLAGDWIDTGLPGTIESAALSGHRAATLVLEKVLRS